MPRNDANHDPVGTLGRTMIVLGWVGALALLTALFGGWLDDALEPNRDPAASTGADGVREVILAQNRSGHYVVSGAINGAPVVFLLDTGATEVSVPSPVANRLGLRSGAAVRMETANGRITTYATRLDRLTIGPIALRGVSAHVNPHMDGEQVLLGMNVLRRLELVQRDQQLTIRQTPGS